MGEDEDEDPLDCRCIEEDEDDDPLNYRHIEEDEDDDPLDCNTCEKMKMKIMILSTATCVRR
ncbi:phosphopantothenoylcysteine decarboxylase subunit VHS3-like [Cucumis melo var. makuwa]|uniref:Phosphopantothenoylcysteine decarboxylase subunit VHS3-like n=2 Tax=Cucumis melo TaxID=3656 RepID=A0A5A7TVT5_CUCMM|nr:phosphopantothenoylcysteine decarboxylase subunit VHS3-like [Cucumis melo var. makuwa]TYK14966.1 phosphopantothenoylcysteine decarboxylase subunit VHS3-like [Cucumis melo var. makuwa]